MNSKKVKNISTTLYLKKRFYNPFMAKKLRKAFMYRSRLKKSLLNVAHLKHGVTIKHSAIYI